MRKVKVLACTCGDCLHWEIFEKLDGERFLKCKTCEEEFPATVHVPPHDKLVWVETEIV